MRRYKNNEKGILLPDSNDIEKLVLLHDWTREDACRAVYIGIYVLNDLMMQKEFPQELLPYVLIHNVSVTCGILGNEKMSVPFVQSQEMKILNSYMAQLNRYGIHIAVSEEIKTYMESRIDTRYIGYVWIDSLDKKVDLYEVLDACSQEERFKKQSTSELFEKALKQFYENDFYYARNTFLEVLKKCPEDKLSRWYAYACEEMFQADNYDSIRHDLFFGK